MNLTRVISTTLDSVKRRITKITRYGKDDDTQTGLEASPYGIDSNPINGMVAVYAETASKGKQVIVGYLNKNQLAGVGEHRSYATDTTGALKFYIWQKADGTCEIGGTTKHMTRFEDLETGFNQLKSDFNAFLVHVHGAAGTPPAPPATPSTASIANAKINEVKTL